MNGAELPDGTIIRAEPADLDYNKKKPRIQEEDQIEQNRKLAEDDKLDNKEVSSKELKADPKQPPKEEEEEDDDLDDFFASLE